MSRIFLAGATGVIGRLLVPLLVARGHAVVGMTRRADAASALEAVGATAVVADVYDRDALAAAVAGAHADVVMHQLTDLGGGDLAANAELRRTGTRNLVDAARAAGVERIVAQSICWIYRPGDAPAREDEPLDTDAEAPARQGTVGAVAALEAAAQELPTAVILRYGMLYGPGTWFAPQGARAEEARAGRLHATKDIMSFVHVEDAAAAAVAALDWPSGPVNVCDDEPAPGTAWVPAFCAAVGAPPPVDDANPRTPWQRGADNRHARHDLGWTPRHPSWRTGFGAAQG